MGRLVALIGVGITIVSIIITVQVGRRGEKNMREVADRIGQDVRRTATHVKNLTREARDVLADLEISVNEAKAHAASDHGDYVEYIMREPAKSDIETMVRLATYNAEAKGPALLYLQQQLLAIYSDYEELTSDIPSLPREQVRVRGILLSHRRQMGVIVAAIRQSDPPEDLHQFAAGIQRTMDES